MNKRIALVTGATKGIGKAITKQLIGENYFVIAVDVDEVSGEMMIEEIGDKNIEFICADISIEINVINLFTHIKLRYNHLDVLINNAGIIRDNMIWKMSVEDFDMVMNVNMKGTWLMCRECSKMMKEQQSGRIINIASRAWLGNRGQSNYSSSKAGVVALTRVLALELGKYNVLVNAVAPGLIDTPLSQKLEPEVRQKLIDAQPTKTMGKAEDIANVVSFLASEKTQFITGQTIYVDGGKSIGAGL
jgi:3-oxoacyl-[acyl-carrier protein] reductase